MADQIYEDGKVVDIEGQAFECVGVTYRENAEGEREGYTYLFRLKTEVDEDRAAEEARRATELTPEEVPAAMEAAAAAESEEVNQPEEPKEETQYVK